MIKNYLKVAFRNLLKHKFYSLINVAGLTVGVTCCLLIVLYVMDELSYDTYHPNADRIYRIATKARLGGTEFEGPQMSAPAAEAIPNDFPEVEKAFRFRERGSFLVRYEKTDGEIRSFKENRVVYADSTLFDFFEIPLTQGDPATALKGPNNMIISREIVNRYFGDEDPINKVMTLGTDTEYRVTGVFEEVPSNTHFHRDMFLSMASLEESRQDFWLSLNFQTYLMLHPGKTKEEVEAQFPKMVEKYIGPEIEQFMGATLEEMEASGSNIGFYLQPLKDIHLKSHLQGELEANGDIKYVYIFSIVAAIILLIACINFMNLSTARSANRAKEVGIRKVMGSVKRQLVSQFLAESLMLSFLSFILAGIAVPFLLPAFNQLAEKELTVPYIENPGIIGLMAVAAFVVGILAGSYPAFFLSAFRPTAVLKGRLKTGAKSGWLRSTLVVFQFSISILLMVGTLVVFDQLQFIQNKKIGFEKEQVLVLQDSYVIGREQIQSFKTEMLRNPNVSEITITGFLPVGGYQNNNAYFAGTDPKTEKSSVLAEFNVDYDYISALGMEVIEGRDFSEDRGTDSSAVIINEATARLFGWDKPLGKQIGTFADREGNVDIYEVIGVVKDFHYESLRDNIRPGIIRLGRSTGMMAIRLKTENYQEVISDLQAKWNTFTPGQPFTYEFMDEQFQEQYAAEQQIGEIFGVFAGLAIFIACLGLFGLASFTGEQRTKEIGIRKVLGASVPKIVLLLSREFSLLVLISFAIAAPLSWWAMDAWLSDFAYRTPIHISVFLIAGATSFLIAWLTISFQSLKAATINPVKTLRAE